MERAVKLLKGLMLLAIIGAVFFPVCRYADRNEKEVLPEGITAVNGRLEVKRIDLASLYAGRIDELLADRGDHVARNQVIARISSAQTEAQLKAAKAQHERAVETEKKISARISELDQQLRLAEIELKDASNLKAERLISQTEYERKKTALNTRKESRNVLIHERNEAKAEITRTEALISEAESRLDDLSIKSPLDAVVEYRLAEPGNVVGAGGRILSVLDPSDITFDVFVPTATVSKLKVGDEARITIDGIDAVIPAAIDYIARDSQFTPKYVETREERAKLLFKVTLRISPDLALQYPDFFKGGMPAIGYINHGRVTWPPYLQENLTALEIYRGTPDSNPRNEGNSTESAEKEKNMTVNPQK